MEETQNKVGRPLEYSPEILKQAQEYLNLCEDEEVQQMIGLSAKGTELYKSKLNVNIPTKGGLARHLGVARETLYDWAKKYPEFSDIMEALGAKQEDRLINNGLSGDYNPTIAKVLLTKHGYREGIETDLTSKGDKLSTAVPEVLAEADRLLREKKLNE